MENYFRPDQVHVLDTPVNNQNAVVFVADWAAN